MRSIIEAAAAEQWPARIAAVISNKADASGLAFAEAAGIPTKVIEHRAFAERAQFDVALSAEIDRHSPDLVVLAGFMRVLTPAFVQHYAGRLLNIHPSLLPSFPGLATHRQALEAGVKFHGATVHFVTAELDHGPIVDQACVPVMYNDTEATLAERVLAEEHMLYPRAVREFIEGVYHLAHGRVIRRDADRH